MILSEIFPIPNSFSDVCAQINADTVKCDVIKYSGIIGGREQTRYCANMFNIGFDCNVVDLTARLKTYPAQRVYSISYGSSRDSYKEKGSQLKDRNRRRNSA